MLMFSYHYYWCFISSIGISIGGVRQWSNEACGTGDNMAGARVSHGEREQRKPRERQDTKQFLDVQLEVENAMFHLKNKIF